jgi:hypothetical protein
MKSKIFQVVMPCSSKTTKCFEGTYHFYLQGQRVSQARYQHVGFPQTTQLYNLEECTPYNHHCEKWDNWSRNDWIE